MSKATAKDFLTVANNFYAASQKHVAMSKATNNPRIKQIDDRLAARTKAQGDEYLEKAKAALGENEKIVTNIMSGLLVIEAKDTPYACSVASEAYWSA